MSSKIILYLSNVHIRFVSALGLKFGAPPDLNGSTGVIGGNFFVDTLLSSSPIFVKRFRIVFILQSKRN